MPQAQPLRQDACPGACCTQAATLPCSPAIWEKSEVLDDALGITCDGQCRANQARPCTTEGRERHEGGPCAQVISSGSAARYAARDLRPDLVAGLALAAVALPSQMATAHSLPFDFPRHRIDRFRGRIDRFRGHRSQSFSCGLRRSDHRPDFRRRPCHLGRPVLGSHDFFASCTSFALMAGGILVCCGLFRLGWIEADLVSRPVTIGFLAGIAFHIVISQLPPLLGIAAPDGGLLLKAFCDRGQASGESESCFALAGVRCLRRDGLRGMDQPAHSRRALGNRGGDYRGLLRSGLEIRDGVAVWG